MPPSSRYSDRGRQIPPRSRRSPRGRRKASRRARRSRDRSRASGGRRCRACRVQRRRVGPTRRVDEHRPDRADARQAHVSVKVAEPVRTEHLGVVVEQQEEVPGRGLDPEVVRARVVELALQPSTTSTRWRSYARSARSSTVPPSTTTTSNSAPARCSWIESRHRRSTLLVAARDHDREAASPGPRRARRTRCSPRGRASTAQPIRSRCAWTARACSSSRPGFAPGSAATLPAVARQK